MGGGTPLRILTVCTANICRSPMAAAILQARLGPAAVVTSAGTESFRLDVPANATKALADLGIRSATTHQSRLVDPSVLAADGADLVLAMAREHQRAVVLAVPEAWDRTFLLRELLRLSDVAGGWRRPGESVAAWLTRLSAGRDRARVFSTDDRDDISDPYGGSLNTFRATARQLDDLLGHLVRAGRLNEA